ncbi:MAG: DUF695 domain-containing protein [Lewinellaceae bacterium]|nr:DUF695 domain-containing protein [Lewinellaceae bacterium]
MVYRYLPFFAILLTLSACQSGVPEGPPIPPHQEDWAVFLREADSGPSVITIDLGWERVAPLEHHSRLMAISVLAEEELPSGFPNEKEIGIANRLQDQLIRALEKPGQGIFVGSITSFGQKSFFFYLNDSRDAERIAGQVLVGFKSRKADQELRNDADWAGYFNILFPTARELAEVQNERVLQSLQQAGDALLQPRPIDHWAHFSTMAQRDSFLREAQSEGFDLGEMNVQAEGSENPYLLRIVREDSIHIPYIHDLTWSLRQKVEKYKGTYEGWETVVARE